MKKIIYISALFAIIFVSCKKQAVDPTIHLPKDLPYLTTVEAYIKQHVSTDDYTAIDFSNYHIVKYADKWFVRLAIKNKPRTDFMLLQTDSLGNVRKANTIHLETKINDQWKVNGVIQIRSPDGKTVINSAITNGYIAAWHRALFSKMAKETSLVDPYESLPEVIVVAYLSPSGDSYNFGMYAAFAQLCQDGHGGSSVGGGYYYPDAALYSYIEANDNSAVQTNLLPDLVVNFEKSSLRPAIDMNAWMKCFTDIPDAGANCSVTLLGDLPVDTDPSVGLNIWSGNTGHCFLQLTKTNGSQSVTQIIGFTPESPAQAIVNTEAFVPGKTVDNAGHKYDCSITMNLTSYGFNTVIDKMKTLSSSMPYSVVGYDCLDYGLEVMNTVRGNNPLLIPKLYNPNDPFSNIATGPKLYTLLENMVANGSPEAGNISIAGPMYAGQSHGACN